jgi:hypothetical protein
VCPHNSPSPAMEGAKLGTPKQIDFDGPAISRGKRQLYMVATFPHCNASSSRIVENYIIPINAAVAGNLKSGTGIYMVKQFVVRRTI